MTASQLTEARKALGMTQAELGLRLHRSRAQINRWENGAAIPHWVATELRTLWQQRAAA